MLSGLEVSLGLNVINLSGIYIHIPFCKQACHYCDFHFSTNQQLVGQLIEMIGVELEMRKDFLPKNSPVKTIYFGGGTPSLLEIRHIDAIINTIYKRYDLDLEEFTLEANPDDLDREKLKELKSLGLDRLSIGIQSFDARVLKFYNRAHNEQEALQAVDLAKSAGFEKLSIDLIYGFPFEDHSIWRHDLEQALLLDPGHISSYALTIEPKTVFGNWQKKGTFREASEDFQAEQFEILMEAMEKANYIQYEISNFGKEGHFAVHNTNYWKALPYLGIGPSAHSFDGKERGFNIPNNVGYIKMLKEGVLPYEADSLSGEELANEYILTSLRTIWGVSLEHLQTNYCIDLLDLKRGLIQQLGAEDMISIHSHHIYLTNKGKLLADSIAASLFIG